MGHRYIVKFAHDNSNVEGEWGWGTADVETDEPIVGDAAQVEVARRIGIKNGFTKVGILEIIPREDEDVIEGEVITSE